MNPATIFTLVNMIALIGWVLLVCAPYSRPTQHLVRSMLLPGILALVYAMLLIVVYLAVQSADLSLSGFIELLNEPWVMVLGWTHLVAFDLIAGIWMQFDAGKRKIRHRYMILPYLLTFILGPVGLLMYLGVRAIIREESQ